VHARSACSHVSMAPPRPSSGKAFKAHQWSSCFGRHRSLTNGQMVHCSIILNPFSYTLHPTLNNPTEKLLQHVDDTLDSSALNLTPDTQNTTTDNRKYLANSSSRSTTFLSGCVTRCLRACLLSAMCWTSLGQVGCVQSVPSAAAQELAHIRGGGLVWLVTRPPAGAS
jgi:hypothetical protein